MTYQTTIEQLPVPLWAPWKSTKADRVTLKMIFPGLSQSSLEQMIPEYRIGYLDQPNKTTPRLYNVQNIADAMEKEAKKQSRQRSRGAY